MEWFTQRVKESSSEVAEITDVKQLDAIAQDIRVKQSSFYATRGTRSDSCCFDCVLFPKTLGFLLSESAVPVVPEPTPYGPQEQFVPHREAIPYGPPEMIRSPEPETQPVSNPVVAYGPPPQVLGTAPWRCPSLGTPTQPPPPQPKED